MDQTPPNSAGAIQAYRVRCNLGGSGQTQLEKVRPRSTPTGGSIADHAAPQAASSGACVNGGLKHQDDANSARVNEPQCDVASVRVSTGNRQESTAQLPIEAPKLKLQEKECVIASPT